jgi:WD40 repeat protein/tRNA A-37 threonylcarbamoyl transferase component Bud32
MAHPDEKIGPYTLVRKIGYGSFGVVWLAEKRTTIATTRFALKLARHEDVEIEAFKQEAEIWVRASGHPNVLTMIEADVYDEQIVIVSEYTPDGSLKDWLRQNSGKAPSVEAAVEMALQILSGLEHLHAQRIIHRDIKPDNILLQRGTPRLADFGIARLLKTDSYSQAVKGTLLYMAPEAFNRKRNERTDVWSIGVVLYQMLSGYLPYDEPDLASLIGAIISREPSPLPESIPVSLRRIVEGALQHEPLERFQSAAEMRSALLSFRREMWQVDQPVVKTDTLETDTSTEVNGTPPSSASTAEMAALPSVDNVVAPKIDHSLVQPPEEISPQPASAIQTTIPAALPVLSPPDVPPAQSSVRIRPVRRKRMHPRTALAGLGAIVILILFVWGILHWRKAIFSTGRDQTKASGIDAGQTSTKPAATSGAVNAGQPSAAQQTPTEFSEWVYKQTLVGHGSDVNALAFSRDSSRLASGSDDATIKLWDAQSGTLVQTLPGRRSWYVRALAFSNTLLASGNQYFNIMLWDAQTGALKKTLTGHTGSVLSLAFSRDGATLASGSCDGKVKLWDAESGTLRKTLTLDSSSCPHVAFSADDMMLASGSKNIKLWNSITGTLKQTLTGHRDGIADIVFSPDGTSLASAGCDHTVKLWDAQTGALKQTLTEHRDCVMSVAFTPDGNILASGSKDKTIKLWNLPSGTLRQTLTGHQGVVWHVVFSPDGKTLASASSDKTVKLWQVKP